MRSRILATLIVVVPFVLVRLPYHLGHPIPMFAPDSLTYMKPVDQALGGRWPILAVRTPGYPLFLAAVRAFGRNLEFVIVAQQVVSLGAQLFFLYSVYRLSPVLGPGAAIAIAVAEAGYRVFGLETSIMADGLYSTCLWVTAGVILRWAAAPRYLATLGAVSLAVATAIATRPAGMFLVGLLLLLGVVAVRSGLSLPRVLLALSPLPLVLCGLCLYNLATIGEFTISPWGTANLLGATDCFWQQEALYPRWIRQEIGTMNAGLNPGEKFVLESSWDPHLLGFVFGSHFNDIHTLGLLQGYEDRTNRALLRKVALDAIRNRPDLYLKFVFSQFYLYFATFVENDWGHYDKDLAKGAYIIVHPSPRRRYLKEQLTLPDIRRFSGVELEPALESWKDIHIKTPFVVDFLASRYGILRSGLFLALWFAVLVAWAWGLLRSGLRDILAACLLAIATMHLAAGVLVSLVEIGETRYSAATDFVVYLTIALAPLLFQRTPPEDVPSA